MKREVLNEISQMKYLFDYQAGKVISEQNIPPSKDETEIFTDGGVAYKLPGITDLAKKDKFTRPTKIEEITGFFNVSPQWVQTLKKNLESVQGDKLKMHEFYKASPVWNLNNGLIQIIKDVAKQGITPDKLLNPSIKNWIKSQDYWRFISVATDPENGVISEEQFFQKLGEFIQSRIDEIKS